MTPLDPHEIREHFPALKQPHVYLDNPGGTQIARESLQAMEAYLVECNANHGGLFPTSMESDARVQDARVAMADFLNAARPEEIVFGLNMTSLTYNLSRALGRTFRSGETLLVTHMDHDGNISPWLQVAEDRGMRVRWVKFNRQDGTLDLDDLARALKERPRLLACGYASNLLGTINPIGRILEMAHEAGALVYLDAVQYAPHGPIDVQSLGADFLVCSAYKFFGPHMGALYGRHDLLENLQAYRVRPAPQDPPGKFETGTGAFESICGLAGVLEYFEWLGKTFGAEHREQYAGTYDGRRLTFKTAMTAIRAGEFEISRALLEGLQSIPGVTLYGLKDLQKIDQRVPTFSFTLAGRSPAGVARALGERNINIWNGNFYALAITQYLGLEDKGGVIRVGPVHYNTLDEIQQFLDAIRSLS